MKKPRVYVETSVVSYLTARPARDIVIAGRQQSTRDWWAGTKERFELVISELVREEAAVGDRDAAQSRLAAISPLPVIGATPEVARLARALVDAKAVPERAGQDAVYIAIAAVHRVPFLVTWNFRHIANAVARPRIEAVCRDESRRRDRSAAPVHAGATCCSRGRR